jgi:hypothetical protein
MTAIDLPDATWAAVAQSLRNQRYELQRYQHQKTNAPEDVREATRRAIGQLNTAIDAIDSRPGG